MHDTPTERDSKAETLAVLLALFPGRLGSPDDIEAVMRSHLTLASDLPAPLFAQACLRVARTWRYPNPPQPGDIRAEAAEVVKALRLWESEHRQAMQIEEMRRQSLTAGEARVELDRIASEPPPTSAWASVATELYICGLKRCIRQASGLKLVAKRAGVEE